MDRNAGFGVLSLVAALVALRKESVDRNAVPHIRGVFAISRSPQGERG